MASQTIWCVCVCVHVECLCEKSSFTVNKLKSSHTHCKSITSDMRLNTCCVAYTLYSSLKLHNRISVKAQQFIAVPDDKSSSSLLQCLCFLGSVVAQSGGYYTVSWDPDAIKPHLSAGGVRKPIYTGPPAIRVDYTSSVSDRHGTGCHLQPQACLMVSQPCLVF